MVPATKIRYALFLTLCLRSLNSKPGVLPGTEEILLLWNTNNVMKKKSEIFKIDFVSLLLEDTRHQENSSTAESLMSPYQQGTVKTYTNVQ